MSTTKETTIWCDADGCGEWIQVNQRTNEKARREARSRHTMAIQGIKGGWSFIGGKDLCPKHARAVEQAKDQGSNEGSPATPRAPIP